MKTSFQALKQLGIVSLLLLPAIVQAATVISVDHRIKLTYSDFQFDAGTGIYSTEVRIKNHSTTPLLAPLRVTVNSIKGKPVTAANPSGIGEDSLPYIEFPLPQGELGANETTSPVTLLFKQENSKEKAKHARDQKGKQVSAAVSQAPLQPRALPYALTISDGPVDVRFTVQLADQDGAAMPVYLRNTTSGEVVDMKAHGKGIHKADITVETSTLQAGTCLVFEAYLSNNGAEVVSPPYSLCASSFPVRIAASNKDKTVTLAEGAKAVADEILVRFVPGTSEDTIRVLLTDINAIVVGSLPQRNLFQLKLPSPLTNPQLTALIKKLKNHPEVESAYPNALGEPASVPNDPEFSNQHGLQRVRAHDAWDANATGSGITVAVLDTGIDRTHADFGTVGDCQLIDNDCGSPNTDFNGHGTQVAGVIAAKTNNALGMAGIAPNSKIKSILVGTDVSFTIAEMIQSFLDAEAFSTATVVNASFGGVWLPFDAPSGTLDVGDLCASVNSVVLNGVTPVAIVASAAGNYGSNGNFYPARCNDSTNTLHDKLTRKDLFMTAAATVSSLPVDPACAPATALDKRCAFSNYGAWVDMAAPGAVILSSALGGGYTSNWGTSFSAPMVAGAAAILRSCGVPFGQIESTLRTSANITVPFPDGSSAPRLDIYRALISRNRAPTGVTLSNNSLNENTDTTFGVDVGTLLATDLDTCEKFTYSIVGGTDAAVFSISGVNANKLRITAGILNFNIKSSYAVIVRVTDFGSQTFDQPLTVQVTTNIAPTISITTPTTNSIYSPPATVTFVVNAADADGTISKVEFYNGATLLGTDTSTPYSYIWSSVPTGTYSITAKAVDNLGAITTSMAVRITVNTLPIVSFTTPSNNAVINLKPDSVIATITTGKNPQAIAVNPVTNKIYVVNYYSNTATVINGVTNTTYTVPVGINPGAIAVNSITNKAYVANYMGNNVTVIDGTTNSTTTVPAGNWPYAIAVNPTTNKIYVLNRSSNTVTVINGATNSTTAVAVGTNSAGIAVNTNTNKIYVANYLSNNVTVIDGATNATTTIAVGSNPIAVAINPVTNKIYIANRTSNTITVINGATNATTTVAVNNNPWAIAVNPITNKIYVVDRNNNVTVIDGVSQSTALIATGNTLWMISSSPWIIEVNPTTNNIYVADRGSNTNTVIDGATSAITRVPVGINPWALAINSATNKTYVANWSSNNVMVIDGGLITLSSNALDVDGTITKVEFYNGGSLLGTDTTAPYSYGWSNVTAGNYVLTAKGYDNLGAVTTSSTVNITVTKN